MVELPPHKKFERQIERIHKLLEAEGTDITWNDRIPDPDYPDRPRQIDITIRRDGSLTIVECRLHKQPQDVTWIEELMGRRVSLAADAVIAVSASGFTKTAQEKAVRYGVFLRDFSSLSREEVQGWGRKWKLTVNFCEFSAVTCYFRMNGSPPLNVPAITAKDGQPISPLMWRLLFQDFMRKLDQDKWRGTPVTVECSMSPNLLVGGISPASIVLKANVRRIAEEVQITSIVAYADPINAKNHAAVAKYELGETEIIENCDETAMILDLSQLKVPAGCCFETAGLDAGRIVNMHISSIIGTENMLSCKIPVQLRFEYARGGKVS